jgi:hypothetical protein
MCYIISSKLTYNAGSQNETATRNEIEVFPMLHIWLIPALAIFALILFGLYLLVRAQGGSGARTTGRTVVDKPGPPEEDLPPG